MCILRYWPAKSVTLDYHGGIVVHARRTAFEHRTDDDDAEFLRERGQRLGRRAGDGLGLVEAFYVFVLAEIHAGVQLLQQHQLRPGGGLADAGERGIKIRVAVLGTGLLHEADGKGRVHGGEC